MKIIRVYYRCVLYEDIDTTEVPVDKAKMIANKLDDIGISKFDIIYEVPPVPAGGEQYQEEEPQPQQ
ncbi:MAG: hypothetical protein GTN97_03380 [Nitrosopumilaceae archaeon]|nr:hypothetical protein [Nitrosopumilaceae archaeon]